MADNLNEIVRRVVSSLQNLPDTASSNTPSRSDDSTSSRSFGSVEEEIGQRFQIPRVSSGIANRIHSSRRSERGRFIPYTTKQKGKYKAKPAAELVIKDVCLLPNPDWDQVPRRQVKEDLVKRSLFVDAWSLDKSWSEDQLRAELHSIFKKHITGPNT